MVSQQLHIIGSKILRYTIKVLECFIVKTVQLSGLAYRLEAHRADLRRQSVRIRRQTFPLTEVACHRRDRHLLRDTAIRLRVQVIPAQKLGRALHILNLAYWCKNGHHNFS